MTETGTPRPPKWPELAVGLLLVSWLAALPFAGLAVFRQAMESWADSYDGSTGTDAPSNVPVLVFVGVLVSGPAVIAVVGWIGRRRGVAIGFGIVAAVLLAIILLAVAYEASKNH